MRRLFFGITLILCMVITGCSNPSSQISSFVPSDNMGNPATTPSITPTDVARVQMPGSLLQDLLAEHDLAYPDPFSQEYPDVLTVPVMVHYSSDSLYYRSYEEMPFVGEKHPMTMPEKLHETLYKYNLSTGEKIRIGDVSLSGYSSGEFLFTEDAYYMFPASLEQGSLMLQIKALNLGSGELQEITRIENGEIYVSSAQTGNGACAFLVRVTDDKRTIQRLYVLNTDRELHIIYDSALINLTSPEFSTLYAGSETLYLLRQKEKAGRLVTEVVEMDLSGVVLRTISLPGLQEYSDSDYFADKLYVTGDYIFVKWYYCGEQLPYFSAFKLIDGKASSVFVPKNTPCYLLNEKPVDNRYLLFSAFPNDMDYTTNSYTSHLYVFDTMYDRFTGISLPLVADVVFNDIVCNENGDIIMNVVETKDAQSKPQKRTIRIDFNDLKSLL